MPALCGVPPYTGLLSNAGVALWLCTSAVLAFAGSRLTDPRQRLGLYLPAGLSLLLGLDDGLMLHESLLPAWLGLDDRIVQPGLYCLYASLLLASLRWPLRGRDHRILFLAALACLGCSVLLDVLIESHLLPARNPLVLQPGLLMWLEDGLKLLGIVAWSGLWAREAHHRLSTPEGIDPSAE
jgi:hypothetical protein